MHPYLPHLLADLETAKANKPAKPNYRLLYPDHPAFEYGLDYIAEWELGKNKPLKGWLGIEPENFPPKDQFEESDLEAVVEKFLDLLLHFNVSVMLPDEMPYAMVYDLLVGYLEEEIHIVSEGSLVMA